MGAAAGHEQELVPAQRLPGALGRISTQVTCTHHRMADKDEKMTTTGDAPEAAEKREMKRSPNRLVVDESHGDGDNSCIMLSLNKMEGASPRFSVSGVNSSLSRARLCALLAELSLMWSCLCSCRAELVPW